MENIQIIGHSAQPFIRAVHASVGRHSEAGLLPRLTWFTLNLVDLRTPFGDSPPIHVALHDWVIDRRSRADVSALHQLEILACSVKNEWLTPFYGMKGMDFLWDQENGLCRESSFDDFDDY